MAVVGPDGPAEWREYYSDEFSRDDDVAATLADEARDDLVDIAEAKMLGWAIDRVLA